MESEEQRLGLVIGDCRFALPELAEHGVRVQTCITSPPYYGLRDYGCYGQIGLEPTVEAYVGHLVEVFRMVRDVLADDGTLWLNLGDSYLGRRWIGIELNPAFAGLHEARTMQQAIGL